MNDAHAAVKGLEAPALRAASRRAWPRWGRALARGVVAIVATGALGLTVAWAFGPERFGLEQAQYVPFPLFLLPTVLAVLVSLTLGSAWRAIAAASLATIATFVMGFQFHVGDAGEDRVRMMTYNVKGYLARGQADGFELILREIALHQPDILVLQDAKELTNAEINAPGTFRALFGDRHVYGHLEYVVVSRYPLKECKPRTSPFGDRAQVHVHCILEVGGTELSVITAHLMSPRYALGAVRMGRPRATDEWNENLAARMSQAEALAADVRASWRPVILAGDLNAPDSSAVVRTLLATGMRDAFASGGKGYGYTWGHSLRPGISFLRIDHILVTPEIGVRECFVGSKLASPHRAVIADLFLHRRTG